MRLFFNYPIEEFHLREISRRAKVVPQNVKLYTSEFVDNGLFIRRVLGNMTLFRINPESDYLLKFFEFFELQRKIEFISRNMKISRMLNEYIGNLIRLSNREIQMIILFGSVARGGWTRGSDIDILIVSAEENNNFTQIYKKAEEKTKPLLEISPIHVTINKIIDGLEQNLEFYDELWRDRIIFYNEYLFWQIVKKANL
ncbi:nucleotidyltransferase domain-containing protein [Acidobacteriota bacterium]